MFITSVSVEFLRFYIISSFVVFGWFCVVRIQCCTTDEGIYQTALLALFLASRVLSLPLHGLEHKEGAFPVCTTAHTCTHTVENCNSLCLDFLVYYRGHREVWGCTEPPFLWSASRATLLSFGHSIKEKVIVISEGFFECILQRYQDCSNTVITSQISSEIPRMSHFFGIFHPLYFCHTLRC